MRVRPIYIQANCTEGKKIDLRQARVVSRYKPDIILFEMSVKNGNPSLIFNNYNVKKKPFWRVREIEKKLIGNAKKYHYALSDLRVWNNIEVLWRNNHNVLLFNIDAPYEIRYHHQKFYGRIPYSKAEKQWLFWVYLYLREMYMKKYVDYILKNYCDKKRLVIAVFLQKIHWDHVKFLLENPSKENIWRYYFGKFSKINRDNIKSQIKIKDKIFYKYWNKISEFS